MARRGRKTGFKVQPKGSCPNRAALIVRLLSDDPGLWDTLFLTRRLRKVPHAGMTQIQGGEQCPKA